MTPERFAGSLTWSSSHATRTRQASMPRCTEARTVRPLAWGKRGAVERRHTALQAELIEVRHGEEDRDVLVWTAGADATPSPLPASSSARQPATQQVLPSLACSCGLASCPRKRPSKGRAPLVRLTSPLASKPGTPVTGDPVTRQLPQRPEWHSGRK
jgi:hypothetical protein